MIKRIISSTLFLFVIFTINAQSLSSTYDAGVRQYKASDFEKSISSLNFVLERNAQYYEALYYRGLCYSKTDRIDLAITDFTACLAISPKFYPAAYSRAEASLKKGFYEAAINDLNKVIQQKPEIANAYVLRAKAYEKRAQYDRALNDYLSAEKKGRTDTTVYYGLANILYQKGDHKQALVKIQEAITQYPLEAKFHYLEGRIHDALHLKTRAIKSYQNAKENGMNGKEISAALAFSLYEGKQYQKSIPHFTYLIQHGNSRNVDLYLKRGFAYLRNAEPNNALKDFNKAAMFDKQNSTAYEYRATAYRDLGKMKPALNDMNKAITLDPKNSSALLLRGKFYTADKKYQLALDDFNAAIGIKKDAKIYFERAICYSRMGDRNKACRDLKKSSDMGYLKAQIRYGRSCN